MEQNDFGLTKGKLFFKLSEISEIGFASVVKLKQDIYKGKLQATKNGQEWRVPRAELLRILNENFTGNK